MHRTALRALIRLIGPLLLVLVVVRMDDRDAVLGAVVSASAGPLALAAALNLVNIHLKVVRWEALLRARGIVYPLRRAWSAYATSLYVGMLTPGRVGDLLRIRYLRHDIGVPYAEGLATIVMDRLCDLYVLAAFVAVGVAHYSAVIAGRLAWVTWGGIALTVLAPLVLLIPGLAERLLLALSRKIVKDPSENAEPGAASRFLVALRAHRRARAPLHAAGHRGDVRRQLRAGLPDRACPRHIALVLRRHVLAPSRACSVSYRSRSLAQESVSSSSPRYSPALGFTAEHGVSFGLLVFAAMYLILIAIGFVSWQLAPPPTSPASSTPDSARSTHQESGEGSGKRIQRKGAKAQERTNFVIFCVLAPLR